MKYDVMLVGVGGEGVLTAVTILARAAALEGKFVRGMQLHGLAQRGGTIQTFVRFGSEKEIFSPMPAQASVDLVLGYEPLEAIRAVCYANKKKTNFVINEYPYVPVYANLLNMPYPKMEEARKRIMPFAKSIRFFKAHEIAKRELGNVLFGNTLLLGAALGAGLIPLKKETMLRSVRKSSPRETEENLKAFELGFKLGKE
jgi:indolepyruvate ferredoxin oxidoreductase beta subunit